MFHRLSWTIFRRYIMQLKKPYFRAHWNTCVDLASEFEGFNKLNNGTHISASKIGRFTYFAGRTRVTRAKIGAFCSIGPDCQLGGFGMHPTDWVSTHPAFYSTLSQANYNFVKKDYYQELMEVVIGNDVWIGARVCILDGCKIGDGAIVAIGSIVTKDVPPYAIVGGIPAKLIRYRFSDDVIIEIQETNWWNWTLEKISKKSNLFLPPSRITDQINVDYFGLWRKRFK